MKTQAPILILKLCLITLISILSFACSSSKNAMATHKLKNHVNHANCPAFKETLHPHKIKDKTHTIIDIQ